jgi:hypothetical protein
MCCANSSIDQQGMHDGLPQDSHILVLPNKKAHSQVANLGLHIPTNAQT